jgi:hypothetical protein
MVQETGLSVLVADILKTHGNTMLVVVYLFVIPTLNVIPAFVIVEPAVRAIAAKILCSAIARPSNAVIIPVYVIQLRREDLARGTETRVYRIIHVMATVTVKQVKQ